MPIGLRLAQQHLVYAAFGIYAFAIGNIFPRLPDIMEAMGVGEAALGLGLIGLPAGTLVALTLSPPLLDRVGYRRALLTLLPLLPVAYAAAVHATGPMALFALLFPAGLMVGATEIILNVEADRTEAMVGRRIMNRAHSFWSFGFFGAGLFGGAMAQLGLSPQAHLALVAPLTAAATVAVLGRYEPAPARTASAETSPRFARPTLPILVLVAVTLSAMLMEGAGMDWSAIYMRSVFESGPFVAGLAVAVVGLSQAVTRFFADSFVDRHSPSSVARVLLCLLALGVVLVFAARSPGLSLTGFALIGVGCSAIFPLAMSAAAQRTDRPAAVNVAALAQISFVAFLIGPPLLGFVAEHWGLRWTFGLGLPLVALSFVAAGALGGRSPAAIAQR